MAEHYIAYALIALAVYLIGSECIERIFLRDVAHVVERLSEECATREAVLSWFVAGFSILFMACDALLGQGGSGTSPDIVTFEITCMIAACGFGTLRSYREFLFLSASVPQRKAALAVLYGLEPALGGFWVGIIYAIMANNGP